MMKNHLAGLLLILGIGWLASACSGEIFVTSKATVDEANELFADNEYKKALEAYDDLGLKNPRIDFNRGLAYFNLKEWDNAIKAFEAAREGDSSMIAAAYYHIGNVHAAHALELENGATPDAALPLWKEALAAFENALLVQPEHADAKRQLEIALLRIDPPCHKRPDDNEPNNQPALAKPIELAAAQGEDAEEGKTVGKRTMRVCPDDEEWFSVALPAEHRLRATLEVTDPGEGGSKQGALEIWTPDGKRRLQPPTGDDAALDMVALTNLEAGGDYRVRVANPKGEDFGATVSLEVVPTCRRRRDDYEPNDTMAQAKTIVLADPLPKGGEGEKGEKGATPPDDMAPGEKRAEPAMRVCPDDEDWFRVSLPAQHRLYATLEVTDRGEDAPKLGALEIWSPDGKTRVQPPADKTEPSTEVSLPDTTGPGGDYHVRVANPANEEFAARLTLKTIPACNLTEEQPEHADTRDTAQDITPLLKQEEAPQPKQPTQPTQPGQPAAEAPKGPPTAGPMRLCPGNADWFFKPLAPGESLRVTMQHQTSHGTPGFKLVDAAGAVVATGEKKEESFTAVAYTPGAKVYIQVEGSADVESVYALQLETISPCAEREDEGEENDTREQATEPPAEEDDERQVCPDDDDVFKVTVEPRQSIVAYVTGEVLHGDLQVDVADSDGRIRGKSRSLGDGAIAMALDLQAGTYYVQVHGADAKYKLKLQVLPECPEGNDKEEKNDDAESASLLEPEQPPQQGGPAPGAPGQAAQKPAGPKLLRICPGDEDWFRIPVNPDTKLMGAQIQFIHEKGDLSLAQYEIDGNKRLSTSDKSSVDMNGEGLVVPPPDLKIPDPTEMKLRVRGADERTQNFYLLSLKPLPESKGGGSQGEKPEPKDNKPQEPKKPKPDKSAFEKKMEREDKNDRNLEAERAKRAVRHEPPALKDW